MNRPRCPEHGKPPMNGRAFARSVSVFFRGLLNWAPVLSMHMSSAHPIRKSLRGPDTCTWPLCCRGLCPSEFVCVRPGPGVLGGHVMCVSHQGLAVGPRWLCASGVRSTWAPPPLGPLRWWGPGSDVLPVFSGVMREVQFCG